jgi:hypothetical protein
MGSYYLPLSFTFITNDSKAFFFCCKYEVLELQGGTKPEELE